MVYTTYNDVGNAVTELAERYLQATCRCSSARLSESLSGSSEENAHEKPERADSGAQTMMSPKPLTYSIRQFMPFAAYPSSLEIRINGLLFFINSSQFACKSTKKGLNPPLIA